jgi:hypothetical protein
MKRCGMIIIYKPVMLASLLLDYIALFDNTIKSLAQIRSKEVVKCLDL